MRLERCENVRPVKNWPAYASSQSHYNVGVWPHGSLGSCRTLVCTAKVLIRLRRLLGLIWAFICLKTPVLLRGSILIYYYSNKPFHIVNKSQKGENSDTEVNLITPIYEFQETAVCLIMRDIRSFLADNSWRNQVVTAPIPNSFSFKREK